MQLNCIESIVAETKTLMYTKSDKGKLARRNSQIRQLMKEKKTLEDMLEKKDKELQRERMSGASVYAQLARPGA